jgi:hypothetical protein
MLSTVVVGLEILTGICAGLEDVEDVEDGEEGEEAEAAVKQEGEHGDRCDDLRRSGTRGSATFGARHSVKSRQLTLQTWTRTWTPTPIRWKTKRSSRWDVTPPK